MGGNHMVRLRRDLKYLSFRLGPEGRATSLVRGRHILHLGIEYGPL